MRSHMDGKPSRRVALKAIASAVAAAPAATSAGGAFQDDVPTAAALGPIADAVLPDEIGAEARADVVGGFIRWMRGYREDADMDHGYGFTRIRRTGPSPARHYPAQLAALDRAAARLKTNATFADLTIASRRTLVAEAFAEARIEQLPRRPTGAHVAADLMAFYFNSSEARDACYEARIGRDACRGLAGSERPPEALPARGSRRGR